MCAAMVEKKLHLEVPLALLRLGTDSLTETVTLGVGPEGGFPKFEHQKDDGRWFQKSCELCRMVLKLVVNEMVYIYIYTVNCTYLTKGTTHHWNSEHSHFIKLPWLTQPGMLGISAGPTVWNGKAPRPTGVWSWVFFSTSIHPWLGWSRMIREISGDYLPWN